MEPSIRNKYKAVIGLEVHTQLQTHSKVYCADATDFGNEPNTQISVISLAHPGTLPRLNKKALEYAIRMGLASHSEISRFVIADRKNYFYPDLPKGYQLTQDRTPICKGGFITITTKEGIDRDIVLNRIHLEEDAGKSLHEPAEVDTLVDFNRAGTALIEIVTEPVLRSSEEAYAFMLEVRKLVRYLGISDGNMEEGSLRCDANVSVMLTGATQLGKKVEIKNMNSARYLQRAIDYEIERQITELESGRAIPSETRMFNVADGKTYGIRMKEELNDYRYFPDPDVSPVIVSDQWLDEIKASLPSLPRQLYYKFVNEYKLPEYDARVLTDSKEVAFYFEEICARTSNFKAASNWVMGPVKAQTRESDQLSEDFPVEAGQIAELIELVDSGKVSFSVASQRLLPELAKNKGQTALQMAQQLNVIQESSVNTLEPVVDEIIKIFPLKVEEYKNGKKGIVDMFMGEVMKRTKGKADPKVASELIAQKLKAL
jgi:aspartyl-tRNA(Asn)/glutamyl-tRNA(Gln) amidotransferase subunit B